MSEDSVQASIGVWCYAASWLEGGSVCFGDVRFFTIQSVWCDAASWLEGGSVCFGDVRFFTIQSVWCNAFCFTAARSVSGVGCYGSLGG
jgi:hypothetical protein